MICSHFLSWAGHVADGDATWTNLKRSLPHMRLWFICGCLSSTSWDVCRGGGWASFFVVWLQNRRLINKLLRLLINRTCIWRNLATSEPRIAIWYIIWHIWCRLLNRLWMLASFIHAIHHSRILLLSCRHLKLLMAANSIFFLTCNLGSVLVGVEV